MIARANELLKIHQAQVYQRTDRMFATLLFVEYIAAVLYAHFFSGPLDPTIALSSSSVAILGAAIVAPPILLVRLKRGHTLTRHWVAFSQMMMAAIFIQLSGGRIVTHFLIFGSLAFLGFYRDWKVLLTASAIVAIDHYVRGRFLPQSVYGILNPEPWRWLEDTAWILFEDFFLVLACFQNLREMQEIATRRAQTENVAAHLEEAIEARDNFLSICSHELKTPLTSLKLQVQMGLRTLNRSENPALSSEAARKLYQTTDKQVDRLAVLVEDMLDVSRIGSGQLTIRMEDVDLSTLVQNVVHRHETELHEAGCTMTLQLEPNTVARCEAFRIEQVVINLISNAGRYASGRPVMISVSRDGAIARLVVRDQGSGIPREHQQKIFERFERARSPHGIGGLGLGLYISKSIIDQHHGRIVLDSEPGQGATFTVELTCGNTEAQASGLLVERALMIDPMQSESQHPA